MKHLQPYHVYAITFDCRPRGCEDEGTIRAYWTGEEDWIGKLTIVPVARPGQPAAYDGTPMYLFSDEILQAVKLRSP